MRVEVHNRHLITVIELHGAVDSFRAAELKALLHRFVDSDSSMIVVDMHAVTLVDTSAMGVLVGAVKAVRARGGDVVLAGPRASVQLMLAQTQLNRVFTVVDSVDAASAGTPVTASATEQIP